VAYTPIMKYGTETRECPVFTNWTTDDWKAAKSDPEFLRSADGFINASVCVESRRIAVVLTEGRVVVFTAHKVIYIIFEETNSNWKVFFTKELLNICTGKDTMIFNTGVDPIRGLISYNDPEGLAFEKFNEVADVAVLVEELRRNVRRRLEEYGVDFKMCRG